MSWRELVAVVALLAAGIVGGFATAAYLQPDPVTTGAPEPVVAEDPSIPVEPPAPIQQDPTEPALQTGLSMRKVSVGSGNNEFVFPAPVGWRRVEPNSNEVKYKVPDNPGNTFVLRVEQVTSQDQTIPEIVLTQEDTMKREFEDYELLGRTHDSLEFSYVYNGYRRFGFMTWLDISRSGQAEAEIAVTGREVDVPGMRELMTKVIRGIRAG